MTADKPTAKSLRALGVNDARGVAEKFAEVRALFDAQAHQSMDRQNWETLRQSWVGRKSGVLTAIAENWLKPETALKRVVGEDRKSTRLNSSHGYISYAVFCLKKKNPHALPHEAS